MGAATTHLSISEFFCLPDAPGKRELLDGEVIAAPPPKRSLMEMAKRFLHLLETAADPACVWIKMGYQLGERWLQPDVSISWPNQPVSEDWFQGAPMLAIEIVSPSNRAYVIEKKIAAYLEEGAAEIWIVYPLTHSMTIIRKQETIRSLGGYHCDLIGIAVSADYLRPQGRR